jgi:hypothetical protein
MFDVQVSQVDGLLVREGVEDALKQGPMLVSVNPMLVSPRLDFLELKAGIWVEAEPQPVLSFNDQVADEETFRRSGQVQDSDDIVDFACNVWADGTCGLQGHQ